MRYLPTNPKTWLVWSMLCMLTLSFAAQVAKWESFAYNGIDLGIYTQVISETSQGRFFHFTIHPHSYLGDHVELLALLLVPLFWVAAHPLWLLGAQTIALALGAIPVFRLGRRRLNTRWGLALAVAYLFSPFLWNANMYEFHLLPFAIPLLLAALDAYDAKSLRWYWLWLGLALLVREDVAFVVFGVGLVAALEKRSWRWWILPMLASTAWFVYTVHLAGSLGTLGQYKFLKYYGWLGPDLVSIIGNFFGHPWLVLQRILHPQALAFLIGLGLPFAFLPFGRLRWLLPVLPIYLQLSLSGVARELSLLMHYVSLFLPFLWMATISVLAALFHADKETRRGKFYREYGPVIHIILFVVAIYSFVVIGPVRGLIDTIYRPAAQKEYEQLGKDILGQIPRSAPLATGYRQLSHAAVRPVVYSLHYLFTGKQQYSDLAFPLTPGIETILIDQSDFVTYQSVYPEDNPDYSGGAGRFRDVIEERDMHLALAVDNFLLYGKQEGNAEFIPVMVSENSAITELAKEFSNGLRLHGWQGKNRDELLLLETYELANHSYTVLPLQLNWSQQRAVDRHSVMRLTLTRQDGASIQKEYPLAPLLPQSEWPLEREIHTEHRFLIPQSYAEDGTTVHIEMFQVRGKLTLDAQRSIAPRYSEYQSLGSITLGKLQAMETAADTK